MPFDRSTHLKLTDISTIKLSDLTPIGRGLNRPECVLAVKHGSLYTCDWTFGIARISADGSVGSAVETDLIAQGFLPNGLALTANGDFLFANLGEAGGVWRVGPKGKPQAVATEVEGRSIPPANFVLVDGDRIWVTVSASSRKHQYFNAHERSGEILLIENGRVSVAARNLTWTNELRIAPDGRHLFVNETFACRTTRFDVAADGSLSNPTSIDYPKDTYPDGMAFDAEGGLWIACVVTNRLLRVAPDLSWTVVFEDADASSLAAVETAYAEGRLTRDLIIQSRGSRLSNLSSLAFGGPDLKTIYLGGLGFDAVHVVHAPIAGMPMAHWD